MSLEKTIKGHLMGESANFADDDEYRHQYAHHSNKAAIHSSHADLYRDDTEDGRALKNYHSTRALLHRQCANCIDSLRQHVQPKGNEVAKTTTDAAPSTPGQYA